MTDFAGTLSQERFLLECARAERLEREQEEWERMIAAVRMQEREKVAAFMLARSIATGHGDTIEDLLAELGGYLDRLHQSLDEV